MAAVYTSRDIVEDFLHYKLLNKGVAWRFPPPPRQSGAQRVHQEASSATSRTSGRGVAPDPWSTPPRLQVALRCAGDELECSYRGNLSAQVSALLPCRDGDGGGSRSARRQSLTVVREELFRDGVNWGRIVAMMELGGALSAEVAKTGGAWQVDDIARWMEESLDSPPLQGWIEDNGGWNAFVELYGESRPPVSFWSLKTVFGLVVLGAAGIALGALFTQK
ncbi:apoptosis regulator Bcl-2-like isoform X2 [Seriola dumerili]|uniref:apoptosis regulator Bcl-2-like isoform X2 n=1 Tax=Seriola dumerili TaxID=41447 RepID=UPI000BBE0CF9|nr:apoptosis regulator Bcl-2-like isoform X2 [Seriola dumerili]